jgi:hypothetical protein
MKRLAAVLSLVVAAVVAAGVVGFVVVRPGDQVATVDGHAITRDELAFHMRRLSTTTKGDLRAQALAEAERDKVLLLIANEQGLVDSVDHADFMKSVDQENARRADAERKGEVVYGLTEFSPEEFYGKRIADLTTELRKRQPVSDAEVRTAFDKDPGAWSANATTYAYSKLIVPRPVAVAGDLSAVAKRYPAARLSRATYQPGGVSAHDQELLAMLTALRPGQISKPVPGGGEVTYYQLDRRIVDEDKAFAEYSPRIRLSLTGEKFSRLVEKRLASSDIKVDADAMADVDAEEVE